MRPTDRSDPRAAIAASTVADCLRSVEIALQAARDVLDSANHADPRVERKADGSLVSEVDREIEQRVRRELRLRHPDHGIQGEELAAENSGSEYQWIIDPIDGTEDYLRGMPYFGTIVGLHYRGNPLAAGIDHARLDLRCTAGYGSGCRLNGQALPALSDGVHDGGERVVLAVPALEDFSCDGDDSPRFVALCREFPNFRTFRTCYGHTLAACGSVDAAVEFSVSSWDLAATRLLIEESGGAYRQFREVRSHALGTRYGAAFGRPGVVRRVAAILG